VPKFVGLDDRPVKGEMTGEPRTGADAVKSGNPAAPRGRTGRPRRAAAGDAILRATVDLLAEQGVQGATMNAIAARAEVGKNTIYRRWSSKEELIADAVADAVHRLTARLDLEHDGVDLCLFLVEVVRDFSSVFADPLLARILPGLLGETQRNPALAAAYVERVVRPRRQALIATLERAVEAGELRRGAGLEQVVDLLIAPAFMRLLHPLGVNPVPPDYAEQLVATVWGGIAPEPAG
jgi:AcrR family transcriptional regulator